MKITLEIANNKAEFLIELLRSLKFVKVTEPGDWYKTVSAEDRKSIEQGLGDLRNNKVHSHDEVMAEARKKT
jgi:hypothetical protein